MLQEKPVERWSPIPLDYLLANYTLKDRPVQVLLVIWIFLIALSIVSILVLSPSRAFLFETGSQTYYTFFMMYPPLILGTLLLFWLGFEWGFIPVFISAFIIAHATAMPVYWSLLFGISFILGLAIFALCYYSIPISPRPDSLKSIAFFTSVAFVAAIASSLGSFVWSLYHNLSPADTLVLWKGWWTGVFLQSLLLVGPLLYFFTPAFERLKSRYFILPGSKVSLQWVYTAIISVVVVLTLFILAANILGSSGLQQELAQLPNRFRENVLQVTGSFQIITWISICLVLAAGLGGIYLVASWNKTLTGKVENQTEQIKESADTLKVALGERDTLLKEIHNRVNDNLTMVLALLELQLKSGSGKSMEEMLKDSHARLRSMAVIYETMYQTESINFVNLKYYTYKLSNRLHHSYKKSDRNIDVSIKADEIKLSIDRAVPFAMILNELIVNSYVHAFKDLTIGTIFIEIRRGDGHIMLAVRDNGIGLPADFNSSELNSLGMKLIHTLTRQLQGEFSVETKEKKTGFVLRMPILAPAE